MMHESIPFGNWEKRWHPLRREWVVYAAHRNNRPWNFEKKESTVSAPEYDPNCYLCPGNKRVSGKKNSDYTDVFSSVFANTIGCELELYNTDGATGAARGAGIGVGVYKNVTEAYSSMEKIKSYSPVKEEQEIYSTVYNKWKRQLKKL